MADRAAGESSSLDPQKTINDVVNNVKSEGIFDQFRKECLEEFENMVIICFCDVSSTFSAAWRQVIIIDTHIINIRLAIKMSC